jgi:cell division protein FtsL
MEMTRESSAYELEKYYDRREYDNAQVIRQAPAASGRKRGVALRRALVLLLALCIATACIAYLNMKAQVYKAQREVNDLQTQINTAQRLNTDLSEQLNEATNVNSVMQRAQQLGMTYPSGGNQVLYVTLGESTAGIAMKSGN